MKLKKFLPKPKELREFDDEPIGYNGCLYEISEIEVTLNEDKLFNFLEDNHNEFTSGDGCYPDWDMIAEAIAKALPDLLEVKK